MKILFNLWLRDKAYQDVSPSDDDPWDEESSDEGSSVVEENEADITTEEGEFRNDGSSILNIDEGNTSCRGLDFENTSSIETVDENGVSTLPDSTERTSPMAKTEVGALDKVLEESNQSPNMDEREDRDLHLLSGSYESTDFGKLRLLLARNPNLEVPNGKNITALAISIRNEKAVADLLDAGVDTSPKDDFQYTAKDYAARNGRPDIVDLFFRDPCAKLPRSKSSGKELHDCESRGFQACVESTIVESDVLNSVQLPLGKFRRPYPSS
ncbi:f13cfb7a-137c-4459-9e70-f5080c422b46 [Sclerotinia trifoliorum]|uniref:F13cfb7a-137c-4459-9e70-f5080c422b46 n=1 Tax=Sclerotinia trifoliorum TaxID=28548 RepID=A0A8H2W1B4_9HELO|nr:f13cfb7a-137c-4459-9e70-f5080c422b46 [Sclerotinia trifoliorum]